MCGPGENERLKILRRARPNCSERSPEPKLSDFAHAAQQTPVIAFSVECAQHSVAAADEFRATQRSGGPVDDRLNSSGVRRRAFSAAVVRRSSRVCALIGRKYCAIVSGSMSGSSSSISNIVRLRALLRNGIRAARLTLVAYPEYSPSRAEMSSTRLRQRGHSCCRASPADVIP